jgi:hypothetical protein
MIVVPNFYIETKCSHPPLVFAPLDNKNKNTTRLPGQPEQKSLQMGGLPLSFNVIYTYIPVETRGTGKRGGG